MPRAASASPSTGSGDAYFYNGQVVVGGERLGRSEFHLLRQLDLLHGHHRGTSQWNGRDWSQPADVDTSGQLDAVSCVSPSFCMAADTVGNVLAWNGSSWSAPEPVDPAGSGAGYREQRDHLGILRRHTFCVAVDSGGKALTFNGTTWSKPSDIDGTTGLASVSCATTPSVWPSTSSAGSSPTAESATPGHADRADIELVEKAAPAPPSDWSAPMMAVVPDREAEYPNSSVGTAVGGRQLVTAGPTSSDPSGLKT